MEKKVKTDFVVGGVFLAFSVAFFIGTYSFQSVQTVNTISAAFFPRILSVLVCICSVILLLRAMMQYKNLDSDQKQLVFQSGHLNGKARIFACTFVMLLAAMLLSKLGFILTMPWMMFLLFLTINPKGKRNMLLYVILSILLPIALFFTFYYCFSTILPMGILKTFLSKYFL